MFTYVVDTRRTERVIHFHISILLSKTVNIISHNLTGKDSLSSRGKESCLVMSSGDDQRHWHLVIHFKCQVIWLEILNWILKQINLYRFFHQHRSKRGGSATDKQRSVLREGQQLEWWLMESRCVARRNRRTRRYPCSEANDVCSQKRQFWPDMPVLSFRHSNVLIINYLNLWIKLQQVGNRWCQKCTLDTKMTTSQEWSVSIEWGGTWQETDSADHSQPRQQVHACWLTIDCVAHPTNQFCHLAGNNQTWSVVLVSVAQSLKNKSIIFSDFIWISK